MSQHTWERIDWIVSNFRDVLQWFWDADQVHGGYILVFDMRGGEIVRVHLTGERGFMAQTLRQQKAWLYDRIAIGLEDRKHGII